MDKQDIIDGLDVILGRRGEKITQGDLLIVEAAIMALARVPRPEANAHEWTWSLDEPFVTGWQWIETWSENTLTFNVLRFHVGDKLDKDVACWRFIEPPKGSPTPQNTQESK
jgi:hypothetical protein